MLNGGPHVRSKELDAVSAAIRRFDTNLMWSKSLKAYMLEAETFITKGVDNVELTARISVAGKMLSALGNFKCIEQDLLEAVTSILMKLLPEFKTIILAPALPAATQEETVAPAAPSAPVASQAPTKEQFVVPTKTPRRRRRRNAPVQEAKTTGVKPVSHSALGFLRKISGNAFDGARPLIDKMEAGQGKSARLTGLRNAGLQMKQVYAGDLPQEQLTSTSKELWELVSGYFPEWSNESHAGFGDWMLDNGFIRPEDL